MQDQDKDMNEEENEDKASEDNQTETDCASLVAERDEYLKGWQRAQADYANLKKETDKLLAASAKYANERLLEDLLPIVEQMDLALSHVPELVGIDEQEIDKWRNWLAGMKAVRQSWEQIFKNVGLEELGKEELFDPTKHEAVGTIEHPELPDSAIAKLVQRGWALHGKVIKPAKVIINHLG